MTDGQAQKQLLFAWKLCQIAAIAGNNEGLDGGPKNH